MTTKRTSTRNIVLSKSMKYVDEDTRQDFREKRLNALESDNFDESAFAGVDDDAYGEDEVCRPNFIAASHLLA
jgi:zinc finger HIT domain-containing protein 1